MAFETILIHVESAQRLPGLVQVAEAIAMRDCSHVIGLSAAPSPVQLSVLSRRILDAYAAWVRESSNKAREVFDRVTAGKPFTSEWKFDTDPDHGAFKAMIVHGRIADLIISSEPSAEVHDTRPYPLVEQLIVEAGRPVILVPRGGPRETCGRRVLVGWNASREATRAVFDALPLLRSAQQVVVLQVGTQQDGTAPVEPSGIALCSALKRHGVRARADEISLPQSAAGAALLSAVKAENADLLVMGGRARWRVQELVLGQATSHVLRNMTVPVLMSH